jgi:hypothetical protein
VLVLAAASSNDVAPGTLGFLVVFGMAVLLFFLFRSMSKHLRRVNGLPPKRGTTGTPEGGAAGSPEAKDRDVGAASARSGATGTGDRREDS